MLASTECGMLCAMAVDSRGTPQTQAAARKTTVATMAPTAPRQLCIHPTTVLSRKPLLCAQASHSRASAC